MTADQHATNTASAEKRRRSRRIKNLVLFVVVICIAAGYIWYRNPEFNQQRWLNADNGTAPTNPQRKWMVDDLLKNYPLVGMNQAQVLDLLGPESHYTAWYKNDHNMVYNLEPSGFDLILSFLVLELDENGIVTNAEVNWFYD